MHLSPEIVHPVETAVGDRIDCGDMVAVVRKTFTRGERGGFADDTVAFEHHACSITVLHHPLSPEQGDGSIRMVLDGDEVDERVRLVLRQVHAAVLVAQAVEAGREAGNFDGTAVGHTQNEARICEHASGGCRDFGPFTPSIRRAVRFELADHRRATQNRLF